MRLGKEFDTDLPESLNICVKDPNDDSELFLSTSTVPTDVHRLP
jgi:hypothetical protein